MFKTKRLEIKPWLLEYAQDFFELTQDQGFNLFPITRYKQETIEDAKAWIQSNVGKYSVWVSETDELLGMGGLTPWTWEGESLMDITYRLRSTAQGKGYGSELAEGLVKYGFEELMLDQITATITPDNIPSKKIAEKLGFKFDRKIELKGVPTDLYRLFK